MSVVVVSWKSEGMKGQVIVEADEFTKAGSTEAKTKAIEEGTRHLGLCGISGSSGPYPFDPNTGEEISDAVKLSELARSGGKVKYRNDFSITQALAL